MTETFFIIKPEAVRARIVGNILEIIQDNGFKIKHLRKTIPSKELIESHYSHIKDKDFFPSVLQYMTSGYVYTGVLEKENAIESWRNLMGPTNPNNAEKNTIRGIFGYIDENNEIRNTVHGSDSYENFQNELKIWYPYLYKGE